MDADAAELRQFIAGKMLDLETDDVDYDMRRMLEMAREDVEEIEEGNGTDDESGARHETVIDPSIVDDTDNEPQEDPDEPDESDEDDIDDEIAEEYGEDFADEYGGLL
jgi:hypothetical protein